MMNTHLKSSLHTLTYIPIIVGISAAASSAIGILGTTRNNLDWKELAIMSIVGTTMGTYFAITGNTIGYGLSRYWR
jgi:hypothetical protein